MTTHRPADRDAMSSQSKCWQAESNYKQDNWSQLFHLAVRARENEGGRKKFPPPLPTPSPDVGAINVSQPGDGASRAFQIRLDHDWKWSLGFVEWWLKSNRWSLWSKLRQVPTPAKLTTPDISTGEHPLWNGNKKKNQQKTNGGESACECILELITSLNF